MKMKEWEIIPYRTEHALEITQRLEERDKREHEDFLKWAKENETPGTSFTAYHRGRIIGCAGIRILWQGVGEAWVFFDQSITECAKEAYYYVGRYMRSIASEHSLHRIQAFVAANDHAAIRYVDNLGFRVEGKLERYGPSGDDYFLYAIVR